MRQSLDISTGSQPTHITERDKDIGVEVFNLIREYSPYSSAVAVQSLMAQLKERGVSVDEQQVSAALDALEDAAQAITRTPKGRVTIYEVVKDATGIIPVTAGDVEVFDRREKTTDEASVGATTIESSTEGVTDDEQLDLSDGEILVLRYLFSIQDQDKPLKLKHIGRLKLNDRLVEIDGELEELPSNANEVITILCEKGLVEKKTPKRSNMTYYTARHKARVYVARFGLTDDGVQLPAEKEAEITREADDTISKYEFELHHENTPGTEDTESDTAKAMGEDSPLSSEGADIENSTESEVRVLLSNEENPDIGGGPSENILPAMDSEMPQDEQESTGDIEVVDDVVKSSANVESTTGEENIIVEGVEIVRSTYLKMREAQSVSCAVIILLQEVGKIERGCEKSVGARLVKILVSVGFKASVAQQGISKLHRENSAVHVEKLNSRIHLWIELVDDVDNGNESDLGQKRAPRANLSSKRSDDRRGQDKDKSGDESRHQSQATVILSRRRRGGFIDEEDTLPTSRSNPFVSRNKMETENLNNLSVVVLKYIGAKRTSTKRIARDIAAANDTEGSVNLYAQEIERLIREKYVLRQNSSMGKIFSLTEKGLKAYGSLDKS